MAEPLKPRTEAEIIADLYNQLVLYQWAGERNTACSCHPEYDPCCTECSVFMDDGKHAENCVLARLLHEVYGYLLVHNEECERKDQQDETVFIRTPEWQYAAKDS